MRRCHRAGGLLLLFLPASAWAGVEVPVDVGIGPAAYWFFGPVADNRNPAPHFGLKLNVQAVLDEEFLDAHRNLIPPKHRRMAEGVTEVRISPSFFIPNALILSPKVDALGGTGVYGVTWRPVSFGVPLFGRKQPGSWKKSRGHLDFEAGLIITYAFLYSDFFATTHFIRPGLDLMLELELAASKSFLVSLGWASQIYIPQKLGELGVGPLDESIFHVGQAFLKLHVRFPYEVKL